jgi:hypothetical protein
LVPLLSKAELDYLQASRQFNPNYSYTIKSRLQKKLRQFVTGELPILTASGYLTEFSQQFLTENCKVFLDTTDKETKEKNEGRNDEGDPPSHATKYIISSTERREVRGSPSLAKN